jgi:hypothetical protein
MHDYIELVVAKISDYAYSLSVDVEGDVMKLRRRTRCEGMSFLTRTLPGFGKDFLTAVETGNCSADLFTSFTRVNRKGGPPKFFRGFFELLFDSTGVLLPEPNVAVASAIHDICQTVYKLEGAVSANTIQEQYKTFVEVDRTAKPGVFALYEQASLLLTDLLADFDVNKTCQYRTGNGSCFGGMATPFKKWRRLSSGSWELGVSCYYSQVYPQGSTARLYDVYPWDRQRREERRKAFHKERKLVVAKLSHVPKDSRGARLISVENVGNMQLQQAQYLQLRKYVERHALTKGHVNFTDQSINRQLAQRGSLTGEYATLDLKDASDRVSLDLVGQLWPARINGWLRSSRSPYFTMKRAFWEPFTSCEGYQPDLWVAADEIEDMGNPIDFAEKFSDGSYGKVPLWRYRKFAPMGSTTCFIVMALTLWAIATAELSRKHERLYTDVFVYGDDLIVRTEDANDVMQALIACGLKLSPKKCFKGTGSLRFRESCGLDSFNGHPVQVNRIKNDLVAEAVMDTTRVETLASWFKLEAAADEACLATYASLLNDNIVEALGRYSDFVGVNIPGTPLTFTRSNVATGLNTIHLNSHLCRRWNKKLHRCEVLTITVKHSLTKIVPGRGLKEPEIEQVAYYAHLANAHSSALFDFLNLEDCNYIDSRWYQTLYGSDDRLFPLRKERSSVPSRYKGRLAKAKFYRFQGIRDCASLVMEFLPCT